MKTRNWIVLFVLLALLCTGLTLFFFNGDASDCTALVYSDGVLVRTIDLTRDAEYRIEFGSEWNVLTVKSGSISVTSASCENGDCIRTGAGNHGAPIVCLPNRLVIEFSDKADLDALIK